MKRSYTRMSDADVLTLLKLGVYAVDEAGGIVGHRKQPLGTFRTKGGYEFVRLYFRNGKRIMAVSKLAWMAKSGCVVPQDFEVHHRDLDRANNAWDNLFCLYEADHAKLHGRDLVANGFSEDAPF